MSNEVIETNLCQCKQREGPTECRVAITNEKEKPTTLEEYHCTHCGKHGVRRVELGATACA